MGVKNLRYLTRILVLTACMIAFSGVAAASDYGNDCTPKSPGYWKNHPEAWPVTEITIGNLNYGYKTYSLEEAIIIMQHPVKGDKVYTMFDALIAAKLNGENGCCQSYDVKNKINEGDLWMSKYYYDKDESPIRANSSPWQDRTKIGRGEIPSGEAIYLKLDAYNNGLL